jgi:hypothetical protein
MADGRHVCVQIFSRLASCRAATIAQVACRPPSFRTRVPNRRPRALIGPAEKGGVTPALRPVPEDPQGSLVASVRPCEEDLHPGDLTRRLFARRVWQCFAETPALLRQK